MEPEKISFRMISSAVWAAYKDGMKLGVIEYIIHQRYFVPVGAVALSGDDLRAIAGFIDRPEKKDK